MEDKLKLSDDEFNNLVRVIHKLTGVTINTSRKAMILSRLRRRVLGLKFQDFNQYVSFMLKSREEKSWFINRMTTHETQFFRTPRLWHFLENEYLQELATNPAKKLNVWSAASSSGEEVYSLAIILQEFKSRNSSFDFEILASDISQQMIETGEQAQYQGKSIEGLKKYNPQYLTKYFNKVNDETYGVVKSLKNRIHFFKHNLFDNLKTVKKFDIISLRNVLIYFTQEDQEKVLDLLSRHLKEEGLLLIGESESLSYIKSSFSYYKPFIYKKQKQLSHEKEAS